MGYLNNSSITVDAILTKKGRELLARGQNEFNITQFALADDEIDYSLWNPNHPLGSAYYGIAIENLPLIEALPDETQMLKYKLVSLPKNTVRIPVVKVGQTSITLTTGGNSTITPYTANLTNGNSNFGYTAILSDSSVATIEVVTVAPQAAAASIPAFIGDNEAAQSVAVTGLEFRITAKSQPISTKTATITIVGNETGGFVTINLTVQKQTLATTSGVGLTL